MGCGSDSGVPGDAVATVDGVAIDQRAFDHWVGIAAKSDGRDRKEVREQVVQQLVYSAWIEGEAEDRGVAVDDAAVKADFERQKKLSFPREAEFERYLKTSGQTEADILERLRIDMLSSGIRDQVTEGEPKVTERQVADYYETNKASFTRPERRDLLVVLTKTRSQAAAARAALEAGESWRTVTTRHSIDKASRANGGRLAALTRDRQDERLGDAVFEAHRGTLTGPVEARHGYWVFEVTRVFRERRQSLEQAKPTIEQLLVSEARSKKLDAFMEQFREKWRSRTECRKGYVTPDCGNAP